MGLWVGGSKQPLPLWFGLFEVKVLLGAVCAVYATSHTQAQHHKQSPLPLFHPQTLPKSPQAHVWSHSCWRITCKDNDEKWHAGSYQCKGQRHRVHLQSVAHRKTFSRNRLIIGRVWRAGAWKHDRSRRFPGGAFYHLVSHPYGEFTHRKQVISTRGEKLCLPTLNSLLCLSCCGGITTVYKAVSEWAVTGGKFVSYHFTADLAEETHWLTDSTIAHKQVTLHWQSQNRPLPSHTLSNER